MKSLQTVRGAEGASGGVPTKGEWAELGFQVPIGCGQQRIGLPQQPPRDLSVAIRAARAIRFFLEANSVAINDDGERALRGTILAAFHEES